MYGEMRIAKLQAENAKLRAALQRIEKWFGEFPETGKYWDSQCLRPMSYLACYGSNGERDFMREIARKALGGTEATQGSTGGEDAADDGAAGRG